MASYKRNRKEIQLILFFVFLKLILHLAAGGNYGFHRDELLYIALGEHPGWGYKEVPPFIAAIARISGTLFGDSVFAMRLLPVLAGALNVYLCGLLVLVFGGKRYAIFAACTAMVLSPAFLASNYLLQPVVFDQLFWMLSALFLVRYIQHRRLLHAYLFGAAIGVGMMNKYTMALFAAALIGAVLLTPERKMLRHRAWFISAIIAFVLFLPNLLWQLNNDLPVVTHMRELRETQLVNIDQADYVLQLLLVHGSFVLLWLGGLIYLLISKKNRRFRFLGIAFIAVVVLLALMHGKVYYAFGAFPMLFAAGGLCFARLLSRLGQWVQYGAVAVLTIPMLLFLPVAIPILPFQQTLSFFRFTSEDLGLRFPLKWEDQEYHATTQDYADMRGWDEIAAHVNRAYQSIPEAEREHASIIAGNYGHAGAIDHLGKEYDLPPATSFSSSYLLWAPDSIATRYVIFVDSPDDVEEISPLFRSAVKAGEVTDPYAREEGTQVYLFSDPVTDVNAIYKEEKAKREK